MQRPGLHVETSHLVRRASTDSASSRASALGDTERPSFVVPKPRRRAMGIGRRRDLAFISTFAIILVVFRLGVDLSSLGGPTVRARPFSELKTWPSSLRESRVRERQGADEGHVQIWPDDTPEDLSKPRCVQFNTRSQCVEWSNPIELDPTALLPDAAELERQRLEQRALDRLSIEARDFVRSTRWLARDWPVNLKWNEMRLVLAKAIWQAMELDRTLILPSFVYMRDCLYDPKVCRVYQPELQVPGFDKTASVFRVPIERFLDLHILRRHAPVLTLQDFLILNTPPSAERTQERIDGVFHDSYLAHGDDISVAHLDPDDWVPAELDLSFDAPVGRSADEFNAGVRVADDIALSKSKLSSLHTELGQRGLALGYSFGPSSLVYDRTVVVPVTSFGSPAIVRESEATILHLAGRAQSIWSPPVLRSAKERTRFFDLAIRHMRPPPYVFAVAKRLSGRLVVHTEDRQWIAVHGSNNIDLVLPALSDVRSSVSDIYTGASTNLTRAIGAMDPPLDDDPFLLLPSRASHAFAPDGLLPVDANAEVWKADIRDVFIDTSLPAPDSPFPSEALINTGALTIAEDLLTSGDRDDVAWLSVFSEFTDAIAVVVASRAAAFVSLAPGPSHDGRFAGAVAELRQGFGLPADSAWLAYADGR